MAEQRPTSPPTDSDHAAGAPSRQPPRHSWLLVTLRRTLFWLILLGVLLYAAQMWWLKRGGQPDPAATPASAASAVVMPASAASSAPLPAAPASAASDAMATAAVPHASAATPGMDSAAPPASSPAAAMPAASAGTPESPGGVDGVNYVPASAAGAPSVSPVTESEIAELAARKLLLPVDGIRPSQLTDTYTQSRGSGRLHEAIDIMAPAGTPVRAVEDGRIVKLFTSEAGGLTLYQFDPSGRFGYYYAHLQGYAEGLQEGQQVRRGDVIGYVGSSGNANPAAPHLHFAAFKLGPERNWWRGAYLNPYRLWR